MKKYRSQRPGPAGSSQRAPYNAGGRTKTRSPFRDSEGQEQDKRDPKKHGFKKRGFQEKSFKKSEFGENKTERPAFGKSERKWDADKRGPKTYGSDKRGFQGKNFRKPEFRDRKSLAVQELGHRAPKHREDQPRQETARQFLSREKHKTQKPAFEKTERNSDTVLIWGFHAVRAAWMNPKRKCFRLWLSESAQKTFEETIAAARDNLLKRPDAKHAERPELDRIAPPGSVHQGIILEVAPLHEPSLHDLISGDNPPDCLIMLDQVTDPHNIGAILRSAAALGAGGVILTERNAPSMTGVLAKSASGAADHIPQVHVVNLARALDELREAGYWSVGLAEGGEKNIDACDLSGRTVLVLGAEGEGLRQLTRKKCDELARLPTGGAIGSLNVSNAAAVALYEAKRQKSRS